MTDLQGNILQVNDNFENISGYTRDELIGMPHSIVNSGHHSKIFWSEVWRHITSGRVWRGEICNRAKNGNIYWVDTFIYPIFDDDGNIANFFSVRNDITEKKLLTTHIMKSEMKLKAIFNTTSDTFFLLDSEGKIVEYNQAAGALMKKYFGIRSCREMKMGDFLSNEQCASFEARFSDALKGKAIADDCRVEFPDLSACWYHIRFTPTFDYSSGKYGVTLTLVDIDRRKKHEMIIEEKNQKLSEIARMQSHEIRGPVATLMGLLNLAECDPTISHADMLALARRALTELDDKVRSIVRMTY